METRDERSGGESGGGEAGTTVELAISGMRCAGCADTIEAALRGVAGVQKAEVSYAAGLARVAADGELLPRLVAAVEQAGYAAAPSGAVADRIAAKRERVALLQTALLAGVSLLLGGHDHGGGGEAAWRPWARALVAVAALAGPGRSFLRGAVASLRARRGTMDLLVALGAGAATLLALLAAAGVVGPELDHGHAAVWLLLFLRIGKSLEAGVRARTSSRLWTLLDALPTRARRWATRDGASGGERAIEAVDASALAAGDVVVVLPGERLPADGVVVEGSSSLETAALTGEALPVDVARGSVVAAGSLNLASRLEVRVTAAGGASQLGQMAAVVRRALIERAPIATLAERIAARFVPAVIVLAAATALGWAVAGAGAATAVGRALATIVVSCPCALALATPAALVAGTSAALARGIVLKEAGVLEALAAVRGVQFDKTGTLTTGVLVAGAPLALAGGVAPLDDGERAVVRALANGSRHAAARAIAAAVAQPSDRAAGGIAPFLAIEEQAGIGVRARHAGREWKLGRLAFAAPGFDATTLALPDDAALVACSIDGKLRAAWPLRDEVKSTARAAVEAMRARGLAVEMVSGDRLAAAQTIGRALGLAPAAIHAEQTPAGKAALVEQRQAAGTPLLFVGDGFNDGAALAVAAVGAACGERRATDLARAAGRMVLLRGDPLDAVVALDLARTTMKIVRQNLFLAVAYNAVALPWAMGLLSRLGIAAPEPAHAGLAMAASSLAVVVNALRLARK